MKRIEGHIVPQVGGFGILFCDRDGNEVASLVFKGRSRDPGYLAENVRWVVRSILTTEGYMELLDDDNDRNESGTANRPDSESHS